MGKTRAPATNTILIKVNLFNKRSESLRFLYWNGFSIRIDRDDNCEGKIIRVYGQIFASWDRREEDFSIQSIKNEVGSRIYKTKAIRLFEWKALCKQNVEMLKNLWMNVQL